MTEAERKRQQSVQDSLGWFRNVVTPALGVDPAKVQGLSDTTAPSPGIWRNNQVAAQRGNAQAAAYARQQAAIAARAAAARAQRNTALAQLTGQLQQRNQANQQNLLTTLGLKPVDLPSFIKTQEQQKNKDQNVLTHPEFKTYGGYLAHGQAVPGRAGTYEQQVAETANAFQQKQGFVPAPIQAALQGSKAAQEHAKLVKDELAGFDQEKSNNFMASVYRPDHDVQKSIDLLGGLTGDTNKDGSIMRAVGYSGYDPTPIVRQKFVDAPGTSEPPKPEQGQQESQEDFKKRVDQFYSDYTAAFMGALNQDSGKGILGPTKANIDQAKKAAVDQVMSKADPAVKNFINQEQTMFRYNDNIQKKIVQKAEEDKKLAQDTTKAGKLKSVVEGYAHSLTHPLDFIGQAAMSLVRPSTAYAPGEGGVTPEMKQRAAQAGAIPEGGWNINQPTAKDFYRNVLLPSVETGINLAPLGRAGMFAKEGLALSAGKQAGIFGAAGALSSVPYSLEMKQPLGINALSGALGGAVLGGGIGAGAVGISKLRTALSGVKGAKLPAPKEAPIKALTPRQTLEKEIFGSLSVSDRGVGNTRQAGPIRQLMRKALEEKPSAAVGQLLNAENRVARGTGRFLQGLQGNLGKTRSHVEHSRELQGGQNYAALTSFQLENKMDSLLGGGKGEKVVGAVDPKRAPKGWDGTLNPGEQQTLALHKQAADFINNLNRKNNFISYGAWKKNQGGKYLNRSYKEYDFETHDPDPTIQKYLRPGTSKIEEGTFKGRKEFDEWKQKESINDIRYLDAKALRLALHNDTLAKHFNWLSGTDLVSDVPKTGWTKLGNSKRWGAVKGKYIRRDALEDISGFQYQNKAAQSLYDLVTWYDRNPIRRARKELLTVWNPGVRLGNRATDVGIFASLGGVNPASMISEMARVRLARTKGRVTPEYRELVKKGVVGTSVTNADITNFADDLARSTSDKNAISKLRQSVKRSYGAVDDDAKEAYYRIQLKRGYAKDEAMNMTSRHFQNYQTVGWLYDLGAKVPIFGNAFVRFQGDLQRIIKSGFIDHPIVAAGGLAVLSQLAAVSSVLAGESPEDRTTRENRPGAPHIPFTDISLEYQTPWGAVNPSRLFGAYSLTGIEGKSAVDDASRVLPFQVPSEKTAGSDPLIGPLVSAGINKDFRGKSVQDPNLTAGEDSVLTPQEKQKNVLKYLLHSYTPQTINDLLDYQSATKGNPNFYGQERSPAQAALRGVGIKVEQYGHKQAEDSRNIQTYFDALAAAKKSLGVRPKSQSKDDIKDAKKQTREKLAAFTLYANRSVNQSSDWYSPANATNLLNHPDVLNVLQTFYQTQKSHDPLWDLPSDAVKKVLTVSTIQPGTTDAADKALKSRLQSSPWYQKFNQDREAYFATFPKDVLSEKPPTQPPKPGPVVKELLDQYNSITDDAKSKKFLDDHPEVGDYFTQVSVYNDQKRQSRGLLPEMTQGQRQAVAAYGQLKESGQKTGSLFSQHPELGAYFDQSKAVNAQADILGTIAAPASTGKGARDLSAILGGSSSSGGRSGGRRSGGRKSSSKPKKLTIKKLKKPKKASIKKYKLKPFKLPKPKKYKKIKIAGLTF